jgi:hypothetical protein
MVIERFAKLSQAVEQGEADDAFWRALNNASGVLFHYPAAQIDRTVRGIEAIANGETYNPLALAVGPPRKSASR